MSTTKVNSECREFSCEFVVTQYCIEECSACELKGCRACSHLDECMVEVQNER